MMSYTTSLVTGFFFYFLMTDVALAYVDPGSISVMLQVGLASVFGALIYFKDFFLGFFSKKPKQNKNQEK